MISLISISYLISNKMIESVKDINWLIQLICMVELFCTGISVLYYMRNGEK